MNTNANDIMECPICMDPIDGEKNKVVTECGHCFHSNCLMTNIVHNGFGCPYCRAVMAEVPEEDDESEDDWTQMSSVVEEVDNSDALQGMRILFQRAEGEEIEEYDEDEDSDSDDGSEDSFDGEIEPRASLAFVTQKLIQRGVSMEDLVAAILIRDHEEYEHHEEFMRTDNELFGKFRIIISNFVPEPAEEVVEEVVEVVEEVVVEVEKEKSIIFEQNENMDDCNSYYQKQRALRYEMIDSEKHTFQFQMKGSCRN
jgi:hypothetical protein